VSRPEIVGTFGVVASTNWIASQVGMGILEQGGNAFDAAVATAFTLHVTEPHMNGIGGDAVVIFQRGVDDAPTVLCGQGVSPRAATLGAFGDLTVVPGAGLLPAVVPGAFDAWMLLLRDHGSMDADTVVAPAIHYAESGVPVYQGLSEAIADVARRLVEWPASASTFLENGRAPSIGSLLRRPALAETLRRLLAAGRSAATRAAAIDATRDAFRAGFVAASIDDFCRAEGGLLRGDDLASWSASYEPTIAADYAGWTVHKPGPWTQGPMLLQTLRLLEQLGVDEAGRDAVDGPEQLHLVVEALKLAFADREAWYGDPDFVDVPLDTLLSQRYAAERVRLVAKGASDQLRPGAPASRSPRLPHSNEGVANSEPVAREVAASMPSAMGPSEGDTCHFDVIDRWGNIVAATPSGGWLSSSPVIPTLGFPLGTRGQMFWLQEGLASSLQPRCRPRTTLSPSLAIGPSGERLAFGTPGGDSQDQWSLQFFLRFVQGGQDLQAAVDGANFQCNHGPGSFAPRLAQFNRLLVESRLPAETIAGLRDRGHDVVATNPWVLGRNCAALRDGDGFRLRAAASSRRDSAYAVGR
jgi:gamma-glutamyltranspeptidase/glutathione hydrolase